MNLLDFFSHMGEEKEFAVLNGISMIVPQGDGLGTKVSQASTLVLAVTQAARFDSQLCE